MSASPLTPENRAPVTVRMRPDLKEAFERAAVEAGMELGTASRQLMELFAARLASGTDYLDAISIVKNALKPVVRVQAGRAP